VDAFDVTVCIPSIPPRVKLLQRAITSVLQQQFPAAGISVCVDKHKEGPAVVRNRLLAGVQTPWIAWLDDDDVLYPNHLSVCVQHAERSNADLVYPWFDVVGGRDPFPHHFGKPWNPEDPVQTTITTLVRTEALRAVGGFPLPASATDAEGNRAGEDFLAVLALNAAGCKIEHVAERTWAWHHHARNTSGLTTRW